MAAPRPMSIGGNDRPIDRLLTPFQSFLRIEAAGGIVLLVCTVVALAWANSPWRESYGTLWHTIVTVGFGEFKIAKPLELWVNDGLMAIFFFVVGLEIKRELLAGELASPARAAIPIAAAVGGMAAPAAFYALLNRGTEGLSGWAIPAATDIAFALGVMALLGKRVPIGLKVFLAALAIVDDLGAVLVIALFYTSDISMTALGIGGIAFAVLVVLNLLHVRRPVVYGLVGIVLWIAFLKSGVHATIAGVLLALTIPARVRIDGATFVSFIRSALGRYEEAGGNANDIMTNSERQALVEGMEQACEHVQTPLLRLEHGLLPWVSFLIMPIFALANAGVELGAGSGAALTSRVSLGIIVGLVLGKQVGIMLFTWLAVRLGLGRLPDGVGWLHVWATSWLAGIGFTMSLFIANLGFEDPALLESAKIGILAASTLAGVVGLLLLHTACRRAEAR